MEEGDAGSDKNIEDSGSCSDETDKLSTQNEPDSATKYESKTGDAGKEGKEEIKRTAVEVSTTKDKSKTENTGEKCKDDASSLEPTTTTTTKTTTTGEGSEVAISTVEEDEMSDGVKENVKEKHDVEEKSDGSWTPLIILAVLFGALAIAYALRPVDGPPDNHNYNNIETFKGKIKKMNVDFPNQHDVYWNMLRNGGKKHLTKIHSRDESDVTPLAYFVAGYAGSRKTVDCFVSRLATAFTNSDLKEHEYIDSGKFSGDDDRAKLFDEILSKLKGTNKLVVVNDIDKLKFEVAQLFMSFADSYNTVARYPQSLIVFTTELPFSYEPSRQRNADEGEVGNHFKFSVWADAHIDQSAPLWSRVGDGLMLVREEDDIPLCI